MIRTRNDCIAHVIVILSHSCWVLFYLQLLVLKYVQNKDVFMRYHKAHLTRRLILDISADSEIEENMVEWLRVGHRSLTTLHSSETLFQLWSSSCIIINCLLSCHRSEQEVGMPADYVNKLARMFQDIKVSEDLNQSFKEMHKHNKLALPGKRYNYLQVL